jgi:hypothetical protein
MPEKQPRKSPARFNAYGMMFASSMPILKRVAKRHGYALAVHGSMHRDLDLIAIPWIDKVSEPEVLVEAIRRAVNGIVGTDLKGNAPTTKPHGRLSYLIFLQGPWSRYHAYIDLSIMPRIGVDGNEQI